MKRHAFACLCLGLLAVFCPAPVRAYVLEGPRWESNTQIVMHLQLGSPASPLNDGAASWNDVAAAALDIWNPHLGSGVQFQRATDTVPEESDDGQNSVFFSNTLFGQSFGRDTLAVTRSYRSGTTFSEADVVVNTAISFNSYRGPLRDVVIDLRRVLLHEFGHVLGLDHVPQSSTAIMTPVVSDIDTLQVDDIAGAAAIYGTPTVVAPVTLPVATMEVTVPGAVVGDPAPGVFTVRLSKASGSILTINYAISGKAVNGVDYALLKGTKQIRAGKTSATIKVKALPTAGGSGMIRTVKLRLAAGIGYTVGTTDPLKVRVIWR